MKNFLLSFVFLSSACFSFAQNIGINTASPPKTFSVNGSILVDQNSLNFGTLDSTSITFGALPVNVGISSNKNATMPNPNGLDFWTNKQRQMIISPIGNIGLNIGTPEAKLHIFSINDLSLTTSAHLVLGSNGATNLAFDDNEIQARTNDLASNLYLQHNGGQLQYGPNNGSNILFDGTSMQSYFNGTASELVLQGISGGKTRLGTAIDLANTKFHISTGTDVSLSPAQSGFMMIGLSTAENIVFDNNEILARNNGVGAPLYLARNIGSTVQLGSGTTSPGSKLHISSGNEVGLTDALSGYLMIGNQAGVNMVADGNEIQVRNNGLAGNLYLQNSGGNIALGQITPSTQLHMTGDITMQSDGAIIQMRNAAGTSKSFMQLSGDDLMVGTNISNPGRFILRTNGGNRVYINSAGAISVGTSTPATGYMLSVNGKVMVEELKVQLSQNWPDYVFDNTYKRKSFSELRNFISENKHLPNIPAAADLQKNGLEIGEMQRRMMEKIEELTLYILELEEKVSTLKK